jgi:hypothetical protein
LIEAIAKFGQRPAPEVDAAADPIAALRPAFLTNRGLDLSKMRDALVAKDFVTIQAIGHNCKGTGAGYGFPDIGTAGSAIEKAARALDSDGLREALGRFEQSILAASTDLKLPSGQLPTPPPQAGGPGLSGGCPMSP